MNITNSNGGLTARVVIEFLLIVCIVAILTFIGHCHMNNMLKTALEDSVARNTRTIAYEISKQMNIEINFLEEQAKNIERGRIAVNDLLTVMNHSSGKHAGIIFPNGEVTAKNIPVAEIVDACKDVWEDRTVVRYLRGIGLIFAVPLNYNGQDCIMFDYYSDDTVREFFKTISYNGDGTIILLNDRNNWTVIADGIPPLINTHPDMDAAWEILSEKNGYDPATETSKHDSGAIFYEFQGKPYFVYIAAVSNEYSFAVSGYVPWDSVAVGFQTLYNGSLIVFGLIAIMLIMTGRAIYKSSENKRLKQEKSLQICLTKLGRPLTQFSVWTK